MKSKVVIVIFFSLLWPLHILAQENPNFLGRWYPTDGPDDVVGPIDISPGKIESPEYHPPGWDFDQSVQYRVIKELDNRVIGVGRQMFATSGKPRYSYFYIVLDYRHYPYPDKEIQSRLRYYWCEDDYHVSTKTVYEMPDPNTAWEALTNKATNCELDPNDNYKPIGWSSAPYYKLQPGVPAPTYK